MSICAWCEASYTPKRKSAYFCSPACRVASFKRQGNARDGGVGLTKRGRVWYRLDGEIVIQPPLPLKTGGER
jgi:hypothetical protein